jgi:hypothetical protein
MYRTYRFLFPVCLLAILYNDFGTSFGLARQKLGTIFIQKIRACLGIVAVNSNSNDLQDFSAYFIFQGRERKR